MTLFCRYQSEASTDIKDAGFKLRSLTRILTLFVSTLFASYASNVAALTDQERADAATETATTHPACTVLPEFYWEIGDANGMIANGDWGSSPPGANDQMNVYSASKWVYGAYVYERRNGVLNNADLRSVRMQDGYTQTSACLLRNTVGKCHNAMSQQDGSAVDKFYYASGHFQKHAAVNLGLSSLSKSQLANEIHSYLGSDWTFTYSRTDLAGGGASSASDYGKFLRKMLNGELLLSGSALGSDAVCTYTGPTDPQTGRVNCPTSLNSAGDEDWDYSIGHWVENDPVWLAGGGDAAFSSPGLAGFYPWIDESKTYYGVLARLELSQGAGAESAACGRLIRKAWLTGTAQ